MAFLYVKAYHGPCNTFHNRVHKPQFLAGLRDGLQKLGFRVDMIAVDFANYCMLEMCGHEVFRCNIKQLHFNTTSDRDVVCQRAIDAVMQSSVKFRRACAYHWFWTLMEQEMFQRGKLSPVDYWPNKIKLQKNEPCKICTDCCNLKSHNQIELKD